MAIFNYILSFYFKVVFLISISIFLAYLFLAKEIQHHQGRDTFFRVYDGIVLSRYSYLFFSYAEYPPETYVYIKNKKMNGKIVVENFVEPVRYKGILNNTTFHVAPYDSEEIKYRDLRYLYLFF